MTDYRVGLGYDVHRLVDGRPLVLGGVAIPFDKGLLGHSDGDVLLHAVTDAVLGACGRPDIGETFPDTDARYAGADSRVLLSEVMAAVRSAGFTVQNADCVVHAERPRLSAYKLDMARSIAKLLGIDAARVTVKAKTNEGFGPVGNLEAIGATCVALVVKTPGNG